MKNTYYLGIDLGTSSVKALLLSREGVVCKEKCAYAEEGPRGWWAATVRAVRTLCREADEVRAIGLSSQVGTYLTDTGEVLSWQSHAGEEELSVLLSRFSEDRFLSEIAMRHPALASYPLPRLAYIKKHFPAARAVMMPKDFLITRLTGNTVSDPYSWRGLANFRGGYADALLADLGLSFSLPALRAPTDLAGYLTAEAAEECGLSPGIPVAVGLNDFFAGLLGMGVIREGDCFELSGTSEHIGYIGAPSSGNLTVSGPYLRHAVTYGGTKASGIACSVALADYGAADLPADFAPTAHTPIFLPYLTGERAPVYDGNARGVFFGTDGETSRADMGYAMLEGVVFSLAHIADSISLPVSARLLTCGGSASNRLMASLKAELFGKEILLAAENDGSALGAGVIAAVSDGAYPDLETAVSALVSYTPIARPASEQRAKILRARFDLYRSLYPSLRQNFAKLQEIKEFYQ